MPQASSRRRTTAAIDIDLSATSATAYAANYSDSSDTLTIDLVCAVVN